MTPIVTEFTPLASAFGGALIGLAAVLLMTFGGRIFGATGILSGAILPTGAGDRAWRWALLAGMVSGPLAVQLMTGSMPAVQIPISLPMIIVGGFLVGVGVNFSSGCTSGHGVCGMARLSPRSIIATLTFMAATIVTVFIVRHVIGG